MDICFHFGFRGRKQLVLEVNSHNAILFILNKKLQNDSTTIN